MGREMVADSLLDMYPSGTKVTKRTDGQLLVKALVCNSQLFQQN